MRMTAVWLVGALFAAGCLGGRRGAQEPIQSELESVLTPVVAPVTPVPAPPQLVMSADPLLVAPVVAPQLRPGLSINVTVTVAGVKEVNESGAMVQSDGCVSLPLLGKVRVADQTVEEAIALLSKQYDKFFVNPQVSVQFVIDDKAETISPWGFVSVLGRVKKPGAVKIPPTQDLTVSKAIQQAGGLDTSAKNTAIRLTRRLPDGTTAQQVVNLHAVGADGNIEDDVTLLPGDVVFVPEYTF